MTKSAQQILTEKKERALSMVGKKFEVQIQTRALSIDKDKKTAIFVMSTVNPDRHGDVIDQKTWVLEYFLLSPMFFLQHDSRAFPIGKWLRVWFEADPENPGEERMVGEAEFRVEFEDAARAFRHVEEGDMNAVSVGFIPGGVDYDKEKDLFILSYCELMECSLVGIGSNRQALVKSDTVTAEDNKEAISNAIEAKEVIERELKKQETNKIIAHLKAREDLNRAIRRLKIK